MVDNGHNGAGAAVGMAEIKPEEGGTAVVNSAEGQGNVLNTRVLGASAVETAEGTILSLRVLVPKRRRET